MKHEASATKKSKSMSTFLVRLPRIAWEEIQVSATSTEAAINKALELSNAQLCAHCSSNLDLNDDPFEELINCKKKDA